MSLIRTVIIDDEQPARNRVRFFLEGLHNIEIIGEAENGEEGIVLIEQEKPQLVILDIQMPKLDGFGLLEKCSYKPAVIFISAYDEYAIHAFEVNAVDYLLKPYTKERFQDAINKVLVHSNKTEYWEKKISRLLETYSPENSFLEQVTVKKGNTFRVYSIDDIDFFKMDSGLLFLHHKGEKIHIDATLNQLESRTPPSHFFRVHRNSLVNLKKINEVIPWGQGRMVLDFGDSGKVHVSKEKIKLFKCKIGLRI